MAQGIEKLGERVAALEENQKHILRLAELHMKNVDLIVETTKLHVEATHSVVRTTKKLVKYLFVIIWAIIALIYREEIGSLVVWIAGVFIQFLRGLSETWQTTLFNCLVGIIFFSAGIYFDRRFRK